MPYLSLYLCAYVLWVSNRGLLSYRVVHWRANAGLLSYHTNNNTNIHHYNNIKLIMTLLLGTILLLLAQTQPPMDPYLVSSGSIFYHEQVSLSLSLSLSLFWI